MSMHRIRSLIYKEYLHHRGAFIFLLILMALSFGILLLNTGVEKRSLSLIQAEGWFLIFYIPLAAMVLGHRLVVVEYHSHTQLFIEALPIKRSEMILIKYVIGLGFLLSITFISITLVSRMASASEHVGSLFIGILYLRGAVFAYFIWSVLFAMGFLGRFRIPIYLSIGFGLLIILETTELNFLHLSPVAIIDPITFPFERNTLPTSDLFLTFLIGSASLAIALILSLVREGSLAESLAQRMTQREKAMMSILFIGFLTAFMLLEEKREKAPYQFTGNTIIESKVVPVKILYMLDPVKPDAISLLEHLETKLTGLQKALNLASLPTIRIAYRYSLDKKTFETAMLNESDGVLVRANFRSLDNWNRDDFTAYLIKAILDNLTNNRSRFEPKRWLHDGFARWWAQEGSDTHDMILLRSLVVLRHQELSALELKNWALFRERNGEFLSEAVACTGLLYLQEKKGPEAVIGLARKVFGRKPPNDIRETIYEVFHPMPRLFQEETGEPWGQFIVAWRSWLDRQKERGEIQSQLNTIPNVTGRAWVDTKEGNIRDILYTFESKHTLEKDTTCALLHQRLTPFDSELAVGQIQREEFLFDSKDEEPFRHLMGRYGAGERVFIALECDSHVLGIPIRIFSKRINMP